MILVYILLFKIKFFDRILYIYLLRIAITNVLTSAEIAQLGER